MERGASTADRSPLVRVATDVAANGDEQIMTAMRDEADSIPVVRTGPVGVPGSEPLVMATSEGRTAFFAKPEPSTARDVVDTLEDGPIPADDADAAAEHGPETTTLPVPNTGPLSIGRRSVLGRCGWVDPLDPKEWSTVASERTAESVTDIGLLGRGRGDAAADDPVANAWETARDADGDSVVVANANETRDEQRADEVLLGGAPIAVLDGIAAVAEYVGADDAVVYLNEEDSHLHRHLREAIDTVAGELPIVPQLVAGPDEYRAGAPTAALEAMEGADRIEPRLQPPSPATHGLYGRPTVIHTPRTFAQVRRAIRDPDAFDVDAADPGTRLITVAGDVADPATIELPSDSSLSVVRDAVELTGSFKMACVGGILGGITRDLDVAPTAQSLAAVGLGTDGVVELLNDDRCVVADVGERARFASTENSGRCVPGREGTKQLTELLRDVYQGSLETDTIRELGRVMVRSSNCQIGAHAPRPVTTAIDEFEPEFHVHADGRCPSGTCTEKL
ncbi:NADH-ubiquinone oxidoreductase-F iron-sulfur binding region domain-containing protein [Haloterrigena salifodinae]|uniref:NADH-ubiquinone oxidoreductase-F iron-sulfur binding region domain-containing protein n=1 Tax=Haloterrigena salifodinae TaxID=2675099 RepID=UPI000F882399|nr:NADH-ubiquinone oxidoreductase-F iron-sulfur binding region domain-containing protein [Haloterrigena salifodinae]